MNSNSKDIKLNVEDYLFKKGIIIYYGEYPDNNSWANRIRHTAKIFDKLNFDYKIVIPFPPTYYKNLSHFDNKIVRLQKSVKLKTNPIKQLFRYFTGIINAYQYIKKQSKLDFILLSGGSFINCYPLIKICKRKGIKVWIDIVDENSKKFEKNKSLKDYLAIINKELFDKLLIHKVDKIFVISNYLLEKYNNVLPNVIVQKSAPTLIDIDEFDSLSLNSITNKSADLDRLIQDPRLKLLYAGSIVRTNGIFFVLDCAADLIINSNYDFLIFIIVLMGNRDIIYEYANKLGIINNLVLLEKQTHSDMPAIYKHCDIMFLPEHGDIIANAGFPGKTAEILASGKPIIATNFSDLGDYLIDGSNAFISKIGDKHTYINNLKTLLDNEELRINLGKKGRETAIKYFDYRKNTSIFENPNFF